ncbi:MAG: LuxR C-terminal-related transcriptional regulator [Burkholderiales bacterium]|nr:LuxR C-terminal-related transcriptional regulator [Burkholderiales bacterium]
MSTLLNDNEYQSYLDTIILPGVNHLIDKDIYLTIINRNLQIEFATDISAQSVGKQKGSEIKGVSFLEYQNVEFLEDFFKDSFNEKNKDMILSYGEKLIYLQKFVFEKCKVVKFIDMLPYNNEFVSYITSYVPMLHPSGEVVAIQSSSVRSYVLRFDGHIEKVNRPGTENELRLKFSPRELEVLFLLSNGATQEQIAQILGIARGTVSSLITYQISPKFNISGANTKILIREAITAGMHRFMPPSLWRPCLIILNAELLDDPLMNDLFVH